MAIHSMQPAVNAQPVTDIGNEGIRGGPEKIHSYHKQYRIQNTRNDDPFPQTVFIDELVRPEIRLNGYDNFFQQVLYI